MSAGAWTAAARVAAGAMIVSAATACQTLTDARPPGARSVAAAVAADAGPGGARIAKELARCERPLGSVAIDEPDVDSATALQSVGLASPTPALRLMLAQSNCLRVVDGAGRASAQYTLTPGIVLSNPDAGGFGAASLADVGAVVTGADLFGLRDHRPDLGHVAVTEAQTALVLSEVRTGRRKAAVEGVARATDVGVSFTGPGGLEAAGAYAGTPAGKVVMAAYVDAFNKLVAELRPARPERGRVTGTSPGPGARAPAPAQKEAEPPPPPRQEEDDTGVVRMVGRFD